MKIYFPDLDAEATIDAELRRGGTASVCSAWDGSAYFGKITRVKFTTRKPKGWDDDFREIRTLHHIPTGGFCFFLVDGGQ